MQLKRVVSWFDHQLKIADFSADYSNNGLQIEGNSDVKRAVFGVDACMPVINFAIENNADFIFVHHGFSWGSEPRRLTGITAARYAACFKNNISLYAAHLPLDAAETFGNNAVLSAMIKLIDIEPFFSYCSKNIGRIGNVSAFRSAAAVKDLFENSLNCRSQLISRNPDAEIQRVAVVSGGGGSEAVEEAVARGADLLVTGEITHQMYHLVCESGIQLLALGHYSSETVGPRAIMDRCHSELGIECLFADIPTGL
jgi:dinuclear metal center YbgI/SA1388 family protein